MTNTMKKILGLAVIALASVASMAAVGAPFVEGLM